MDCIFFSRSVGALLNMSKILLMKYLSLAVILVNRLFLNLRQINNNKGINGSSATRNVCSIDFVLGNIGESLRDDAEDIMREDQEWHEQQPRDQNSV